MFNAQWSMNNRQHYALILAAGFSTRMGTCKTTLPWRNDRTLLYHQAEQFLQAGITPIIILGSHNAHRQNDCPDGSKIVINPHSDRGKTSSILIGLQALPLLFSTVTISAVDQPRSSYIYQSLLQTYQLEKALIVAPSYDRKLGHPLLFSHQLLPELKEIQESTLGLRNIVKQYYSQIKKVEFATSEISFDLNNTVDYQAALQQVISNK